MAGVYVQTWSANGNLSGGETLTVSGATANNLLVGSLSLRQGLGGETITTPTGWTLIHEGLGTQAGAFYYRIATGDTNDNMTWAVTSNSRWAHMVQEFSGILLASPFTGALDGSNENETYLSTVTSSVTTGSVTPSESPTFAVTMLSADGAFDSASLAVDSSFTNMQSEWSGSTSNPIVAMASLRLTSTSAVNPTWSGDGSDNAYAALAVFKEAAGGSFNVAWAQNSTGIAL